jgi:hypothetical protein
VPQFSTRIYQEARRAREVVSSVARERFQEVRALPAFAVFLAPAVLVIALYVPIQAAVRIESLLAGAESSLSARANSPFIYSFSTPGVVNEADTPADSSSPYFWVNSGGKLIVTDAGYGETIQGDLSPQDPWFTQYANSNAEDTDRGAHPQNVFRLVTQSTWENVTASVDFYIVKDELSASANRNESNGLLLMSRYNDAGETLYYAGVRVDGTAVIKKKYKGDVLHDGAIDRHHGSL